MEEAANEKLTRLHAIVEGRVQGVSFRFFVQENAHSLSLKGWVRNRWNGNVEVMAEGERGQLEKLLQAIRRGPRAAFVTKVQEQWLPATGEFAQFNIRTTQ